MEYADRHRMDEEMTIIFLEIMRSLDQTWIQYQNKSK